jgi:hypothetical protein
MRMVCRVSAHCTGCLPPANTLLPLAHASASCLCHLRARLCMPPAGATPPAGSAMPAGAAQPAGAPAPLPLLVPPLERPPNAYQKFVAGEYERLKAAHPELPDLQAFTQAAQSVRVQLACRCMRRAATRETMHPCMHASGASLLQCTIIQRCTHPMQHPAMPSKHPLHSLRCLHRHRRGRRPPLQQAWQLPQQRQPPLGGAVLQPWVAAPRRLQAVSPTQGWLFSWY